MNIARSVAAMAAMLLVLGSGPPAEAADASHGGELAKRWCATCHIVAPDQVKGGDNVPSFASIAHKPDFSAGKARLVPPRSASEDAEHGADAP